MVTMKKTSSTKCARSSCTSREWCASPTNMGRRTAESTMRKTTLATLL